MPESRAWGGGGGGGGNCAWFYGYVSRGCVHVWFYLCVVCVYLGMILCVCLCGVAVYLCMILSVVCVSVVDCVWYYLSVCVVCVCAERAESGGAEGCAVQTRSPQSHWRPAQAKNGECFACPSLVSLLSFVSTPPLQQERLPTSGGDFACAMVFLHMHILLLPPYMQCMLTSGVWSCPIT